MVAIICALEQEVDNFKNIDNDVNVVSTKLGQYFLFNKNKFVLTFCGVGKVNAAISTVDLINNFNVEKVLNIGTCASNNLDFNTFDLCLIKNNYYLDVDLEAFGYKPGQLPKLNQYFDVNNKFNDDIKNFLNKNNIKFKLANNGSSDAFLNNKNILKINKELLKNIDTFEMEAAAINHVIFKSKINCSFIKIVSDSLHSKNLNSVEFKNNLKIISKTIFDILKSLILNFK